MLAAGREGLRKALAEIVEAARNNGWVDADKAERWLEKLEEGRVLRESWPRYEVGLMRSGSLVVKFGSTNPDSIQREAQRFRDMGLEEGRHFTVKMPEGGKKGYVSILKEGLAYAARLSMAAEFINYILQRAKEEGPEVYKKVSEIIEEGMTRGSLTLKGFKKEVEVNGRRHDVKVIDGDAEPEKSESGKLLLRIRITAEVDGVRREYAITFGRYGRRNATEGYATARADAPGGRETDAERLAAVIKALTGKEPRIIERSDGTIEIICSRAHLVGLKLYAELTDTVDRRLEATSRRRPTLLYKLLFLLRRGLACVWRGYSYVFVESRGRGSSRRSRRRNPLLSS